MGSGCKRNEPAILTSCRSDPPVVSAKGLAHNGLELVIRGVNAGRSKRAELAVSVPSYDPIARLAHISLLAVSLRHLRKGTNGQYRDSSTRIRTGAGWHVRYR